MKKPLPIRLAPNTTSNCGAGSQSDASRQEVALNRMFFRGISFARTARETTPLPQFQREFDPQHDHNLLGYWELTG